MPEVDVSALSPIYWLMAAVAFGFIFVITSEVDRRKALSRQNIRVNVPSKFSVGIYAEPEMTRNAAERLLGLNADQIQTLAEDIILGQLRLTIALMDIEEIKKLGLKLINTDITDINDSAGYIEALGKEAAAKAINDAKIGKASAEKEQNINLAEAGKVAVASEQVQKAMADEESYLALVHMQTEAINNF